MEDDGNCFFVKNVAGMDKRLVAEQKMERLLGRKSLGVVERLEHLGRRSMGRGSVDEGSRREPCW